MLKSFLSLFESSVEMPQTSQNGSNHKPVKNMPKPVKKNAPVEILQTSQNAQTSKNVSTQLKCLSTVQLPQKLSAAAKWGFIMVDITEPTQILLNKLIF